MEDFCRINGYLAVRNSVREDHPDFDEGIACANVPSSTDQSSAAPSDEVADARDDGDFIDNDPQLSEGEGDSSYEETGVPIHES